MTDNVRQGLAWHRSIDNALKEHHDGSPWYVETVVFKNGHTVFLQDDGDGEFSLTFTDENQIPYFVQTHFTSWEHAKNWLEENDGEKLLDIVPALREFLKPDVEK